MDYTSILKRSDKILIRYWDRMQVLSTVETVSNIDEDRCFGAMRHFKWTNAALHRILEVWIGVRNQLSKKAASLLLPVAKRSG